MYKMCIFVINQPQYILQQFNTFYKNGDIMNILTYIGIAIGGLIAVGSTLGITLGIVVTIIYKIFRAVKYKISLLD